MDSILIGQKLEALRHCITRIVERCPADVGLLAEDADPQDIVVLSMILRHLDLNSDAMIAA